RACKFAPGLRGSGAPRLRSFTPIRLSQQPRSSGASELGSLYDYGHPLPATDACGAECVTAAATIQLVQQVDRYACAGRGEGMRDRDRTAVDVRLLGIQAELFRDRGELRRERLVDVDEVHVVELESGLRECLARGGRGTDAHDLGLDAGNAPRDESPERLQALTLGPLRVGNHDCGRTITDAARIAGRHQTVLAEVRLERSERFERRLGTHVLIRVEHDVALARPDRDRRNLRLHPALVPRALRTLLRAHCDL